MSKISMPCIFPRISRRSRPVDCSRSVGTVPGFAPGALRSSSVLISAHPPSLAIDPPFSRKLRMSQLGSSGYSSAGSGRTVELLEALHHTGSIRTVAGLLIRGSLAYNGISSGSYDSSLRDSRRTMELAKVRLASARGAVRRMAAMAERWRNIAGAIGAGGVESWVGCREAAGLTCRTLRSCHAEC